MLFGIVDIKGNLTVLYANAKPETISKLVEEYKTSAEIPNIKDLKKFIRTNRISIINEQPLMMDFVVDGFMTEETGEE